MIKELRVIPDAHINFQSQYDGGGPRSDDVRGRQQPGAGRATARNAIEQMRTLKELRDPRINGDMARPELVMRPRLDKAAQLGITVAKYQRDRAPGDAG